MRILQGNSRLARNNVKLGGLDLVFTQAQHRTEVSLTFSMRDAFILHVSAYNTASPSLTHTISLHTDPYFETNESFQRYKDEEVSFIEVKEHAEDTLHTVIASFVGKKETLNEVPSISSCFDELKAALRTNDFAASSVIRDRIRVGVPLDQQAMRHLCVLISKLTHSVLFRFE
jgi:hypothetical protein